MNASGYLYGSRRGARDHETVLITRIHWRYPAAIREKYHPFQTNRSVLDTDIRRFKASAVLAFGFFRIRIYSVTRVGERLFCNYTIYNNNNKLMTTLLCVTFSSIRLNVTDPIIKTLCTPSIYIYIYTFSLHVLLHLPNFSYPAFRIIFPPYVFAFP